MIFLMEEASWVIEEEIFLKKLLCKWPKADLERPSSVEPSYQFTWSTLAESSGVFGTMSNDKQSIRLDGHFHETAEFAVWFQQQYAEQDFWLMNESGDGYIKLRGKTEEQVLAALLADPFPIEKPT